MSQTTTTADFTSLETPPVTPAADKLTDDIRDLETRIEVAFDRASAGFVSGMLRFKGVEAHEHNGELLAQVFLGETLDIDPDKIDSTARYFRALADALEGKSRTNIDAAARCFRSIIETIEAEGSVVTQIASIMDRANAGLLALEGQS